MLPLFRAVKEELPNNMKMQQIIMEAKINTKEIHSSKEE